MFFIGGGGSGKVWKGELDGVGVAVKVLSTGLHAVLQGIRKLEKDITVLSQLHHPHIVQLLGACPEKVAV